HLRALLPGGQGAGERRGGDGAGLGDRQARVPGPRRPGRGRKPAHPGLDPPPPPPPSPPRTRPGGGGSVAGVKALPCRMPKWQSNALWSRPGSAASGSNFNSSGSNFNSSHPNSNSGTVSSKTGGSNFNSRRLNFNSSHLNSNSSRP